MESPRSFVALICCLALFASLPALAEEKEAPVVEAGRKISIEYTLTLDDGTSVQTNVGEDPLVYVHGAGEILPALEHELEGLAVDDQKKISLTAAQGYGAVDPEAFQEVGLETVPEDSRQAGAMLVARDGEGNPRIVRVHEVRDNSILLDLNHPLAGENLHFDVRVTAIE